ncbi:alpha-1,3-mannosyl-glycoprotein 4-beta-N-acetylglucosaminyltransferase C-like [Lacerta agilis]|uniref:alpha-1,3-mannosyl-glycoprotein 4-beta-N-acetylglucosaminyltransferase C-like n=1 Tax=Lacerta agilis TaxID=80427 RepID=UPI001419C04D|nr:alpha-1,3-mannosyl-glycoprotein 4-beta-N-acetylglucosaminyltransferase C-like [Lacerta agilis]
MWRWEKDRKETVNSENIILKKNPYFNVMESATGLLPIQYKYLLGSPPSVKRFLTIGISSFHKKKEHLLLQTIDSIFSHCHEGELNRITVVIYLANNDSKLNEENVKEMKAQFSAHVKAGRLLVIQSSLGSYPPVHNLKVDLWGKNIKYKSKQNVDYAYLVNFCANLSQYYLMLEDDTACATGFVSIIQSYVRKMEKSWTTIAFSKLGYIGKLYHSSDLTKLARFLLMFYDVIPADWLMTYFLKTKMQGQIISYLPSLFQHVGRISSFHELEIEHRDPEFSEDPKRLGNDPPASCFTNMLIYRNYKPANVCPPGRGFFWGMNVTAESYFTIVFDNPIIPQKIQISTGSAENNTDILHNGFVEKGWLKVHLNEHQTCLSFERIGDFKSGFFEMEDQTNRSGIECLRIKAAAPQKHWLRIRRISIWVKKS